MISIPEALENSVRTCSANLMTKLHPQSMNTLKNAPPQGPKIDKRIVQIDMWTPRCPFVRARGPLEQQHGVQIEPQGPKMGPLRLPNGNFGYPKTNKTEWPKQSVNQTLHNNKCTHVTHDREWTTTKTRGRQTIYTHCYFHTPTPCIPGHVTWAAHGTEETLRTRLSIIQSEMAYRGRRRH